MQQQTIGSSNPSGSPSVNCRPGAWNHIFHPNRHLKRFPRFRSLRALLKDNNQISSFSLSTFHCCCSPPRPLRLACASPSSDTTGDTNFRRTLLSIPCRTTFPDKIQDRKARNHLQHLALAIFSTSSTAGKTGEQSPQCIPPPVLAQGLRLSEVVASCLSLHLCACLVTGCCSSCVFQRAARRVN